MEEAKQLLDIILNAVIAIIGLAGIAFGGWQVWEGFTSDQPENKKKGFIILIATVVVIVLIFAVKEPIYKLAFPTT